MLASIAANVLMDAKTPSTRCATKIVLTYQMICRYIARMTSKALSDIRGKLGLSQAELAAALNQSSVTISRWENNWKGARIPSAIARQIECLEQVFDRGVDSAEVTREEFAEALKHSGVAGAIAAAAGAGLISRTVLSSLAVIPAFGWLGTVCGIGVAYSLPFFSKLREVSANAEKPLPHENKPANRGTKKSDLPKPAISARSSVQRSKKTKKLRKEI